MMNIRQKFASYFLKHEKDLRETVKTFVQHEECEDLVFVIVEVDHHKDFIDVLQPDFNWQEIRNRGETPYARIILKLDVIKIYLEMCNEQNKIIDDFIKTKPEPGFLRGLYLGNGYFTFHISGNEPQCWITFENQKDRIQYFVNRIKELGRSASDTVIVIVNVDTLIGKPFADVLMPDGEMKWQEMRNNGQIPYARGLANRDGIFEAFSLLSKELAENLRLCDGIPVVIIDYETVEIFSAEDLETNNRVIH